LLWRVGRDPGFRLGTERGFLRGVVEVHFAFPVILGRAERELWCAIAHLRISFPNLQIPGLRLRRIPE
jgi:hypothetical protein